MTITLIIPFYNAEKWLDRCLDSVAEQSRPFDEVILVDDGSTDKSANIASKQFFESWQLYENAKNYGVSYSRNRGLKAIKTDYATFLDADDELALDACEKMHRAIEQNSEANIIQFNHWRKYANSEQLRMKHFQEAGSCSVEDLPERPLAWYAVWNKIYRTEFLRKHDFRFDESMEWGEDELFNLQAIIANGGVVCKKESTCIRHFDNSQSLNHIYRDSEHAGVLIKKLEKIKKMSPALIEQRINELKEVQKELA